MFRLRHYPTVLCNSSRVVLVEHAAVGNHDGGLWASVLQAQILLLQTVSVEPSGRPQSPIRKALSEMHAFAYLFAERFLCDLWLSRPTRARPARGVLTLPWRTISRALKSRP
jgi:hypothetical protein